MSERQPNIIFILADDMGYGDFGLFNYGLSSTPVLDELIGESVCLTQHYSGSPICAPARASLLTGRHPHRTGAIETRELRGLCNLALRETTLPQILKRSGYATGLVGKWHNGSLGREYHPNARGFDEFIGFRSGWQDYYEWVLDRNGRFEKSDGRYLTDVFTDESIEFVERHRGTPFFLNLTYNAPHDPLQAPPDEIQPFADAGSFARAVSTIYAMIHIMDRGIGRILEALKRLGLDQNTIVMFTSDNGPQFGGTGDNCHDRFNCGLNGSKSLVYEGGIRVPLILRWPAGLEGGRHFHEMVHFCDWLPTLLAAAGMGVPQELDIDGADILPVLRGEGGEVPATRFWQWNRYAPVVTSNAAMRDGDWKLVRPAIRETFWTDPREMELDGQLRKEPWKEFAHTRGPYPERDLPEPHEPELYDLAEDPGEELNLAAQHPDRVRKMLGELEAWFENVEQERATIDDTW